MKHPYLWGIAAIAALTAVYTGVAWYWNQRPLSDFLEPTAETPEQAEIKHLIPLEDIVEGGPQRDGIPPIDDPQFESVLAADVYLSDTKSGIDIAINGRHRFYPFQILVWHEVVNETFAGVPLLVTYSPLCQTGIVYERTIAGEVYDFGTSGLLYDSNLLMYDRQTDSLWSQARGLAVVGELTGTELKIYPYQIMTWAEFREAYPRGEVLSRKTGAIRDYTTDPYGDYYTSPEIWFPLSHYDDRLSPKTIVYGVIKEDGSAIAYPVEAVEQGQVELPETFFYGYWFSWAAAHHETEVYSAPPNE